MPSAFTTTKGWANPTHTPILTLYKEQTRPLSGEQARKLLLVFIPSCSWCRSCNKALPEFRVQPLVNFCWLGKAKNPGWYQEEALLSSLMLAMWIKSEIGRGAVCKIEFGPQSLENFCSLIWEAIWTLDWDTEQDCPCHLTAHGYEINACHLKPLNFEVVCYGILSEQEVAGSRSQKSFSERVILKLRSETIQSQSCDDQSRQKEFQHVDKDAKVGTGLARSGNWKTIYEAGWYKGLSGREVSAETAGESSKGQYIEGLANPE